MAISITYQKLLSFYHPKYWKSFEEFEVFYIQWLIEISSDTVYYTNKDNEETEYSPVNHFPELKEYEVWESGFETTGQSAIAHLVGKAHARNFAQACNIVMCKKYLEWVEQANSPDCKDYADDSFYRWSYDPTKLSYWGCSLYWNEELARKAFG